jgi:ATP-binding cassette subfamily G (WHITE) protein 2 (PDR)
MMKRLCRLQRCSCGSHWYSVGKYTLFFTDSLTLSLCTDGLLRSVLVPPNELPRFWNFVYRVSPITYFVDGTAVAGLANMQLHCSEIEFLHINPPLGQSCADYLTGYVGIAGGYLGNADAKFDCLYCPVTDANSLLSMYGTDFQKRWRNPGFLAIYSLFNVGQHS